MYRLVVHTVIAAALTLAAPLRAELATWTIDSAHSGAHFSVRHLMVSTVRGDFAKLGGTAHFDLKDPSTGSVEVTIDAASISTRNEKRDAHLRSADFFDVANFPTITFKSRKIEPAGQGRLKMTGDLTLHGVTKTVVWDIEGPSPEITQQGRTRVGASATTRISRKEFGLTWNRPLEAGGWTVGDEVDITIDVELIKKTEAPATGR